VSKRITWLGAGVVLVLAALVLGWTGRGLAFSGGEVYGHLWTWWWHGQALPGWPAGTDGAIGTAQWPVIDRVPAAIGAVLSLFLPLAAVWNIVVVLGLLGAAWGGAWLARRAGGDPWVGGAVLAGSPVFWGGPLAGLSEDFAVGLLAVVIGLAWIPPQQERERWSWALGLCLGALAWFGLYLFWMGAWVSLVGGVLQGRRLRESYSQWAKAALLALCIAGPVLWGHGARVLGEGHGYGSVQAAEFEPAWRANPWHAADAASLILPGRAELPEEAVFRFHPGYVGLIALGLAMAARRRRWWLLFCISACAACGPTFRFAGHSTGVPNPMAYLVDLLPGGSLVNHHARLLLVGLPALAVLASLGWTGWSKARSRWTGWAPGVVVLILLDGLILGPVPFGEWFTDLRPRSFGMAGALPLDRAGALLAVPVGGPGVHPQRPLFDQVAHRYPVLVDPNRPGAPEWMGKSATGRWLLARGDSAAVGLSDGLDWCDLARGGVAVLGAEIAAVDWLSEVAGPPDMEASDGAAWRVSDRCPGDAVPQSPSPGVRLGETTGPP
jgi:hypothetical protein